MKTELPAGRVASLLFVLTSMAFALGAEHHRATRLGNPATRFAAPLATVDDLRARFRDETLRPDFAEVLRQWGWRGDVADLHRAAGTVSVEEVRIPVGTTMPFMSSREDGKAICLRNVLWAGPEPIQAYAFDFESRGERYRCITPKPCSNFFVEHLGPVPKVASLKLECSAPAEIIAGRPVVVCLTVHNSGNAPERGGSLRVSIPPGATPVSLSQGGGYSKEEIFWNSVTIPEGGAIQYCATFATLGPAIMPFRGSLTSASAGAFESACVTRVIGIPAILLEVIDQEDPIEVGGNVVYKIRVTNQGTATGTNIRLACALPPSQEFVSASGATQATRSEQTVNLDPLPSLAPKATASWHVIVKAGVADDARFAVELVSDQFERPINETEATRQY